MILAHKDGNIGYVAAGANPLRKGDPTRSGFVKTDENDWIGLIDPKDNLALINPKQGFVATANNKYAPDSYIARSTISANPTARFMRIYDVLK